MLIRYTLHGLRARPGRTLLTIAGIALGVSVVLAIQITNQSTLASVERVLEEASGRAHLQVESAALTGEGFGEEVLNDVARVPGVELAVPSLSAPTLLAEDADQWEPSFVLGQGFVPNILQLYGVNPALDPEARVYRMVEGSFLAPGDDSRVMVITDRFAERKGVSLGADLDLLTPRGTVSFRVTGLMATEGFGATNGGDAAVAPLEVIQELFDRGGRLDQIDVIADSGTAQDTDRLEALRGRMEEDLGEGFRVFYPAARGRLFARLLSSYQQGLAFFSAVAAFVGSFLIYNTFSMTVVERTREIGLLRTVGAMRRQIMELVFLEALFLGAFGAGLGVLAGIALSRGLMISVESLLGVDLTEAAITPVALVLALSVGFGLTLVSALLPARGAARISPLEALGVRARTGRSWVVERGWVPGLVLMLIGFYPLPVRASAALPVGFVSTLVILVGAALLAPAVADRMEMVLRGSLAFLFGSEGRMGSANTRRDRGRSTLTVAALMVGVVMIVDVGSMTESFRSDIEDWVERALGGDLYIRSPIPMRPELGPQLASVSGVEAVSPVSYVPVRTDGIPGEEPGGDTLLFAGVDPTTHPLVTGFQFAVRPDNEQAVLDALAAGDAILISTVVSERYGLEIGDRLRLATDRGGREFAIAGILVDYTFEGLTATGSRADLRRLFGTRTVSVFVAGIDEGASPDAVAGAITEQFGDRYHLQVQTNEDFRGRVEALTDETFGLFNVLALIAVLVAALGVANTLLMNVLERIREIGVLRSLGMTRRQVGRMVRAEAAMLGALGAAFGLAVGVPHSVAGMRLVNQMSGYRVDYVFPLAACLLSIVAVLLVSQLAALYPARRAARLNIVRAIQHE
ncbi:MAG: FtsX-like permease family protein [Anaerolineae bacterium]